MCTCKRAPLSSYTSADQRQQLMCAHSFCPKYNSRPASYQEKKHSYHLMNSRQCHRLVLLYTIEAVYLLVFGNTKKLLINEHLFENSKTAPLTAGAESPYFWHSAHCLTSPVLMDFRSPFTPVREENQSK